MYTQFRYIHMSTMSHAHTHTHTKMHLTRTFGAKHYADDDFGNVGCFNKPDISGTRNAATRAAHANETICGLAAAFAMIRPSVKLKPAKNVATLLFGYLHPCCHLSSAEVGDTHVQ